jgi:glycosyltransferase
MKVSVITGALNSSNTIEDSIRSVLNQSYKDIEHIIIDGGSTDGTLDIIYRYKDKIAKVISEPDNGIYDALNKGIRLASGDIVGILHSDDFYAHDRIIEKVVDIFQRENVDSCYGDLEYISRENPYRVIRYWKVSPYSQGKFENGWQLPHPTFFVKKWVYDKYGCFNTDFKISADYELMLRFLIKYRITTQYIPEVLIKMRIGGLSNKRFFRSWLIKGFEDYRAWKVNGLKQDIFTIFLKYLVKAPQFVRRI